MESKAKNRDHPNTLLHPPNPTSCPCRAVHRSGATFSGSAPGKGRRSTGWPHPGIASPALPYTVHLVSLAVFFPSSHTSEMWLMAERCYADYIIGWEVLEQFTVQLPAGTLAWVQCHHSTLLEEMLLLAEDHLLVLSRAGIPTPSPTVSLSFLLLYFPMSRNPHPCTMAISITLLYFCFSDSPNSLSLSLQEESSILTKTEAKPRQVFRHCRKVWLKEAGIQI